jgi:hypothetical protein
MILMTMQNKTIHFLLLVIFLCLTGCSIKRDAAPSEIPPQTIRVGLPTTLSYLIKPFSACAELDPTYDIVLLEKNSTDWMQEPVDLVFTIRDALPVITNTYLINEVQVVIIASQDFPLQELSLEQLQMLYSAAPLDAQSIGMEAGDAITLWGFESGSNMASFFEDQYQFKPELPGQAYLAADPQSMIEQIAQAKLAIGYTLSPAITDQIKVLSVTGAAESKPIPVIASYLLQPTIAQESLIRCLQNP